jgi:hypothetical protein
MKWYQGVIILCIATLITFAFKQCAEHDWAYRHSYPIDHSMIDSNEIHQDSTRMDTLKPKN